jgi:hypothetical protein
LNTTLLSVLGTIAPDILGLIPGGSLVGDALKMVSTAVLGHDAGSEDDVKAAIDKGLNGEQIAALAKANNDVKIAQGQQAVDMAKNAADAENTTNTLIVSEAADARKSAVGNDKIYDVALFILGSFLIAMIAVLWGCWELISGSVKITAEMAGMFAAVTGLVGAIVGYFASNAQTVINFMFGGSLGGRKNADAVAAGAAQLGDALGKVTAK